MGRKPEIVKLSKDVIMKKFLKKAVLFDQDNSYHFSYQHFTNKNICYDKLNEKSLIIYAGCAYSWMPTTITIKNQNIGTSLEAIKELLSDSGKLSEENIKDAASFLNGSIIGLSKVLHFLKKDTFPIWDTGIYCFIYNKDKKPSYSTINRADRYKAFWENVWELLKNNDIQKFVEEDIINQMKEKYEYGVEPVRALELAMFSRRNNT